MRKNIKPSSWQANLSDFSERNKLRATRLEVFGRAKEVESDFWLEDGLLLAGIALERDSVHGPSLEIMLQVPTVPTRNHMTHTITGVKRVGLETVDGRDEALEIEDREGSVTIMHFESEVQGKT